VAARLAAELTRHWRAGAPLSVEELLTLHPEIADQPQVVVPLIYEEIVLRQEAGLEPSAEEYRQRFPCWQQQVGVLFECQRLLGPAPANPAFPAVGEMLGGFRLLTELGCGRQGRVFLATQPALADRPVVLKLTPLSADQLGAAGCEQLSLARLQHTHIVPLLFVQEEPARRLLMLCMPYFGGASLARLLKALPDGRPVPSSGRQFLEALDHFRPGPQVAWNGRGSGRPFLAAASAVQAVCWIGICLADALHHAHQQGLIHLDVKPSNVLLTADGRPMLLDFHLAREPLRAGSAAPDFLGGTPGYMAPEQEEALAAVRGRRLLTADLNGRADIYALGMLLCHLLGGPLPRPAARGQTATAVGNARRRRGEPADRPPLTSDFGLLLRRCNAQVSVGLADIIGKCLAADPRGRYASAADLATDLRLHLEDRPLRGVRNRSWVERWRKWRRRRPHGLALLAMLAIVLTAAAAATALTWNHLGQKADAIRDTLREGQRQLRQHHYAEALITLRRGQALAQSSACSPELQQELARLGRLAEQGEAVLQLHRLAEQIRFLVGDDELPPHRLQTLETQCRRLWERREQIMGRLSADLDRGPRQQVRADLLDLAILWADLHVRQAGAGDGRAARQEALRVLAEARTLLGSSAVLARERRRHAEALGPAGGWPGDDDGPPAPEPPRTSWEYYALGRSLLHSGCPGEAADQLARALELEPQGLWPNYYLGLCAHRLGRYQEAVMAFSACAALVPEAAPVHFNRALALEALGCPEQALRDYNRAPMLDPRLPPAALNRGLLHYRAGRHALALADLQEALVLGAEPAATHYNLALVHLARGDRLAARGSVERALQANPGHQQARQLRDSLNPD